MVTAVPEYQKMLVGALSTHTGIVPTLDGEPVSFVAGAA